MADSPQAVLVIDVQVGNVDPDNQPVHARVLENIAGLIGRARAKGIPVIHMQHHSLYEGDALVPGNPDFEIHPMVAPAEGERVLVKHSCDSFLRTGLDELLKSRNVRHIAVAGFATNFCVDTTCRSALSHGYDVTLAADGHATGWTGGKMSIEDVIDYHNQSLAFIDVEGASIHVVPAAEILA